MENLNKYKNDNEVTVFAIAGPSGVGKTTIVQELYKYGFRRARSLTTRSMREGEENGVQHVFVSDEEFEAQRQAGELFMINKFYGAKYAQVQGSFKELANEGYTPINEIYIPNVREFKTHFKNCIAIFIKPENDMQLVQHMKERGDSDKKIHERINELNIERQIFEKEIDVFDFVFTSYEGLLPIIVETIIRINYFLERRTK